jgi:hypothetical protein
MGKGFYDLAILFFSRLPNSGLGSRLIEQAAIGLSA